MELENDKLVMFDNPKCVSCYKIILIELKYAWSTYKRAIQNIFDNILHKNVEYYVDDLITKSNK